MNIAFHSFKGGVGRTKLMVGAATLLAVKYHRRVAMLDFDLDASGLNTIFKVKAAGLGTRELLSILITPDEATISKSVIDDPERIVEERFGKALDEPGRLQYLPTVSDPEKSETVRLITDKEIFINDMFGIIKRDCPIDVVFADIKPGYSPSFRATIDPMQKHVVVARLDRQNLEGLQTHIPRLIDLMKGVKPIIVANLVPMESARKDDYLAQLGEILAENGCQVDVTIPLDPEHFFDEDIEFVTREDSPMRRGLDQLAALLEKEIKEFEE